MSRRFMGLWSGLDMLSFSLLEIENVLIVQFGVECSLTFAPRASRVEESQV